MAGEGHATCGDQREQARGGKHAGTVVVARKAGDDRQHEQRAGAADGEPAVPLQILLAGLALGQEPAADGSHHGQRGADPDAVVREVTHPLLAAEPVPQHGDGTHDHQRQGKVQHERMQVREYLQPGLRDGVGGGLRDEHARDPNAAQAHPASIPGARALAKKRKGVSRPDYAERPRPFLRGATIRCRIESSPHPSKLKKGGRCVPTALRATLPKETDPLVATNVVGFQALSSEFHPSRPNPPTFFA